MGSDMYLDPPSAECERRWAGGGDIINLKTGEIKKKHKIDKPMPKDFKWVSDVSKEELIKALSKTFKKHKYDDGTRMELLCGWAKVLAGTIWLHEFFNEIDFDATDEDIEGFKNTLVSVERQFKLLSKDSMKFLEG